MNTMQNLFDRLKAQLGLPKELRALTETEGFIVSPTIEADYCDHLYNDVLFNLDSRKVFLDPEISLIKLSSIIGTNTTYLSNAINKYFRCNFKTLINKYRIEYCMGLLSSEFTNLSVKEMAKVCGFASVSAFYASFKKITGVSPLQYKVIVKYKKNYLNEKL